jgi:transcriptional regulator with GAF, ATPase, and Fis domain
MRTGKPIHAKAEDGSLMLESLRFAGYPERCRAAVVCPIYPTSGESILGFLVIGINQRKTFDEEYSLFVQLLSRQCSAKIASVVLFEDEIRQSQKAAKLAAEDRITLSDQLAERTQEGAESENRFTKIWENAAGKKGAHLFILLI